MAIQLPNYLQTGSYAAKRDRRVNSAEVMREGIVRRNHYKVAQRGAGANMSVDVAAGEAWVKGDASTEQGYYHVVNDATVNATVTAANATNPRIDAVVLAVNDSTEIGGADSYLIEVIAGTPTAGATLANLKGLPAIGATKLLLSYVLVPAAATKIETASIGGLRDPVNFNAEFGLTKAEAYAIAEAPPQYAHGRPLDWIPMAAAVRSAAQVNFVSGTNVPLEFTASNIYDTEEIHSNVTNVKRMTCKTPGIYLLECQLEFAGIYAGYTALYPALNGNAINYAGGRIANNTGNFPSIHYAGTFRLGYGDYIEWYAQQSSGSTQTASGEGKLTWQGI